MGNYVNRVKDLLKRSLRDHMSDDEEIQFSKVNFASPFRKKGKRTKGLNIRSDEADVLLLLIIFFTKTKI